jgi:hypothetical protein
MRIPASWVIAGAMAIGLTSCGGEDVNTSSSPSPSPSANATASASPSASPAAASSFSSGTVVAQKGKDGKDAKDGKGKDGKPKDPNSIPGLVKSTDPSERAKLVQSSIKSEKSDRIDPFSSLPPLIAFSTPRVAGTGLSPDKSVSGDKSSAVPELPKFPEIKFPDMPKGSGKTPISPNRPPSSPANPSGPLNPKAPTGIPAMPPIPQPTLARQVEVTGVVKIGGTVQAIVKAPNEPTSRYVGIGQRLSNGQILVKRIELNPGSEPIVILEENGIEVPVMVGSSKKKTP